MTSIYFVRHAQPDTSGGYNPAFPLTEQGVKDSLLVTDILMDKGITAIYSSSYIRSVLTLKDFSEHTGLEIQTTDDLRERGAGNWQEICGDYSEFIRRQMIDFDLKADGGESMNDVKKRTVAAVMRILSENDGKAAAVGTHGMALAGILSHYFPAFNERIFSKYRDLLPFVLRVDFENGKAADFRIELAICRKYPNGYIK